MDKGILDQQGWNNNLLALEKRSEKDFKLSFFDMHKRKIRVVFPENDEIFDDKTFERPVMDLSKINLPVQRFSGCFINYFFKLYRKEKIINIIESGECDHENDNNNENGFFDHKVYYNITALLHKFLPNGVTAVSGAACRIFYVDRLGGRSIIKGKTKGDRERE